MASGVTTKNIGRVLGSQIYVGSLPEEAQGDIPFALNDLFIDSNNGSIYQYDGDEWVFKFTLAVLGGEVVKRAYTQEEALGFDQDSIVALAPLNGVAKFVRVATDMAGDKSLEDIDVGDGVLPFITKVVSDLQNYYLKSETYTQGEVDAKIGALKPIEFREVDELPPVGESNVIYLVPHLHEGQLDRYDEYCWVADKQRFEKLGNTDALANYYNKTETDGLLALKADKTPFDAHVADTTNPHGVTKAQVGLGNVDNTSDANKPVSTAQQAALDLKANQSEFSAHENNKNNPHGVTKAQVGLGNVDNTSDANKPVSTAQQTALNLKADKATTYTKAQTDELLAPKATRAEVEQGLDLKANDADVYKKAEIYTKGEVDGAIASAVSSVYRYKGSVETYAQLPLSGMTVGDVYNVETADPTHGVNAGDNVAWNGMTWDVLAGTLDLSDYYTKGETDTKLAGKANVGDSYTKAEEDALLANKADLVDGKVPLSELPPINHIHEYADLSSFPANGVVGDLYIAKDTNKQYRYDATNGYVELSVEDEVEFLTANSSTVLTAAQIRRAQEGKLVVKYSNEGRYYFRYKQANVLVFQLLEFESSSGTNVPTVVVKKGRDLIYNTDMNQFSSSQSNAFLLHDAGDNFFASNVNPTQSGKRLVRELNVYGKLIPNYTQSDAGKVVKINSNGDGVVLATDATESEIELVAYQTTTPLTDEQMQKAKSGKLAIRGMHSEYCTLQDESPQYLYFYGDTVSASSGDYIPTPRNIFRGAILIDKTTKLMTQYTQNAWFSGAVIDLASNYNNDSVIPSATGKQLIRALNLRKTQDMITPNVFDTTATYAVGDVVIYQNKLYQCHTAVETAGAWTGNTNWTETNVIKYVQDTEDTGIEIKYIKGSPYNIASTFTLTAEEHQKWRNRKLVIAYDQDAAQNGWPQGLMFYAYSSGNYDYSHVITNVRSNEQIAGTRIRITRDTHIGDVFGVNSLSIGNKQNALTTSSVSDATSLATVIGFDENGWLKKSAMPSGGSAIADADIYDIFGLTPPQQGGNE